MCTQRLNVYISPLVLEEVDGEFEMTWAEEKHFVCSITNPVL